MKTGNINPLAEANRVSYISILLNCILSVIKILSGIFGHSSAMVSDGIHSASDLFSTLIVIIGFKVSSKQADDDHPYGHERLECVSSILLAMILAIVGFTIGKTGILMIVSGNYETKQIPSILTLIVAIISITSKEWMYRFTMKTAKKIHSPSLTADAWHHRSDALSSIGSLIGIGGAILGFPVLDPLASVVICIMIIKVAFDIFMDSIDKLTDRSCDEETRELLRSLILKQKGVLAIDDIKTRIFGARLYVDVEIRADGSQSLWEAHAVAEKVHNAIETELPIVKHCMVHVNPQ